MIQLNNIKNLTEEDIPNLMNLVDPILNKRKKLFDRLNRKASDSFVYYEHGNDKMKIPFEQFITAIASGYLAGKEPVYTIADNDNDEKNKIIKDILGKDIKEKDYKNKMEVLVEYITNYNDDGAEHFDLTFDALGLTSCYEILWEDDDNELRYKSYDPLQTVAIYDYTVDKNLIGIVRKYTVQDITNKEQIIVELTDDEGTRTFNVSDDYKEVTELEPENHSWGDVPVACYESDFSIFETVVDLIKAFEQVVQNNRNLFEYNDTGCKLKVKGYAPVNEAFIEKEVNGKYIKIANPDRIQEDKFVLESKVFYLGEEGDIEYITKDINDGATQNTIKTYMELITMMSCVPNVTDTGFTNADNNSAIKNKYFALSQKLIKLKKGFEKMYQRRWELIFNRLNLKKNEGFDFRDIKIELPVNIPTNEQEEIDNVLKLKDIISDETLITKLGYNYKSEKAKIDDEAESNFEENMNNIKNATMEAKDDNTEDLPIDNNNTINNKSDRGQRGEE